MTTTDTIKAPRSWENSKTHFQVALQHPWYKYLTIIQDEINHSSWSFFRKQKIRTVNLPITTGAVTSPMGLGSDSLPVKINLEGVDTYLSDSMQFHLEYALRYLDEGVHYIMPSFRGEPADPRHLCQFYHSEAEIKGGLQDVMLLVNKYIHQLCIDLLTNVPDEIRMLSGDLEHIEKLIQLNANYPSITLSEAIEELGEDGLFVTMHSEGFKNITHKGEQELIKRYGGIVWLTHHEYMSVPFYQAPDSTGKYALNGDLLFGIGEVVGAGERNTTGRELRQSMQLHDVHPDEYEWYVNMKDWMPMRTAGFGMGIERFILWLIRHDDIRDCQLIPRFNGVQIHP